MHLNFQHCEIWILCGLSYAEAQKKCKGILRLSPHLISENSNQSTKCLVLQIMDTKCPIAFLLMFQHLFWQKMKTPRGAEVTQCSLPELFITSNPYHNLKKSKALAQMLPLVLGTRRIKRLQKNMVERNSLLRNTCVLFDSRGTRN